KVWEWIVLGLLIISGYVLYYTNKLRAVGGIETYYSDGWLITLNTFSYVLFFGLLSGFVIAKILKKAGHR
ncbi:MAG: hypothetical protein ACTSQG_10590, partial [Promethearchaeota archaeon]